MSDYEFKPRIPVECVRHVIAIVRSGDVGSQKGELLQHCGAILGELGALVETFESDVDGPFASVDNLGELIADIEDQINYDTVQMNPMLVALIVKLVEFALDKWLK